MRSAVVSLPALACSPWAGVAIYLFRGRILAGFRAGPLRGRGRGIGRGFLVVVLERVAPAAAPRPTFDRFAVVFRAAGLRAVDFFAGLRAVDFLAAGLPAVDFFAGLRAVDFLAAGLPAADPRLTADFLEVGMSSPPASAYVR